MKIENLSKRRQVYNLFSLLLHSAPLVAQTVKRPSTMRETRVQSLGREDPLEKETSIHSSTISWKIPWTEEPGRLHVVHGVTKSRTRLSDFTSLPRSHLDLFMPEQLYKRLIDSCIYPSPHTTNIEIMPTSPAASETGGRGL